MIRPKEEAEMSGSAEMPLSRMSGINIQLEGVPAPMAMRIREPG